MIDAALDATVTRLVVAALDAARVTDSAWQSKFKINGARLARIRQGRASLSDAELDRISRATGEPWQNLVLGVLGADDELTADTRELLSSLHTLERTARAEGAQHGKRQRQFDGLRHLIRKKSA